MPRHEVKIGRPFGIDLYVHVSLLVLFAWAALAGRALNNVLLLLAVFVSIALHEMGHALMAPRFGISTRDITLYLFGGISSLHHMPSRPREETLVTLAGPAVNFALALILAAVCWAAALPPPWQAPLSFSGNLFWILVWLGGFNLLPAFPMDGGRVLRAWLVRHHSYLEATRRASIIGKVLAGLFVVGGLLMSNIMLMVVGWFVWGAADAELSQAREHHVLQGGSRPKAL